MPEGDTVWLTAQRLHAALAGRPLSRFDLRVPRHATSDLRGSRVTEVVPRGKHLLVRIEDGRTLHSHLRLDGTWAIARTGARWPGGPAHQIRAVLGNSEWVAVGYRLHDVALLATRDEHALVGHLGPDLLGPDWDRAEAIRRLSADPDRQIGPALLDQSNLAGIGNLYLAESLFLHATSPWTPVGAVADLPALVDRVRRLMTANRGRPEQVTTGGGRREAQWVHGRAGRACLRCGGRIRADTQGAAPYARTTFWCPRCQPGPGPGPLPPPANTGRATAPEHGFAGSQPRSGTDRSEQGGRAAHERRDIRP